MAVRRRKHGDPGQCVPKTNERELICVRAKRRDRTEGHEHFARDEMRKANARFKEIQAELCKPGKTPKSIGHTFEERAREWCDNYAGEDSDTPLYAVKRAFPIIGRANVSDLNHSQLKAVQTKLLRDGYAYNTVDLTMHFVKTVMRTAIDDRIINHDPTIRLKMPKRKSLDPEGKVGPSDIPTLAEVRAILAGAPEDWRWAIYLGFGCGMRVGEIIAFAPFQLKPLTGTLTIDAQQQRRGRVGPKTWRGVREIEPAQYIQDELRHACKGKNPALPLATGPRGGKPRRDAFYEKAWHPALKAAGLAEDAYRFHAARHFCVSSMLAHNVPIPEIAHYIGDAVETVSRVYAHWLRDSPSRAKQALDETFAAPKNGRHLASVEDQAQ
jgi:integrase